MVIDHVWHPYRQNSTGIRQKQRGRLYRQLIAWMLQSKQKIATSKPWNIRSCYMVKVVSPFTSIWRSQRLLSNETLVLSFSVKGSSHPFESNNYFSLMYKAVLVLTMTLNVSRSCDEWTAAMTTRDVYLHVRYNRIDIEWEIAAWLILPWTHWRTRRTHSAWWSCTIIRIFPLMVQQSCQL